jgi:hypothetical protein
MKNVLKKSILATGLVLALYCAVPAGAQSRPDPDPTPRRAPELDPSLAIGGVYLLVGTLTVLRSRRNK